MFDLEYAPDHDVKVHEEGAIRLICAHFQSHETGLPEWLKNSADAYAREDTPQERRVIVVLLCDRRPEQHASISCLDFCGMTSDDIEQKFRIWADPNAATREGGSADIQGGHGNGGKCYMTQMFEAYGILHTVKAGRGNRYGVVGGSIRFGYIPDRERGRNMPVSDLKANLEDTLSKWFNMSLAQLPDEARVALDSAEGFTLISGVGPKGYRHRIPAAKVLENLENHAQMIRTLELCKVFVVHNGKILNDGLPLALPDIPPIKGAEEPREIRIPLQLKDPRTGRKVQTASDEDNQGILVLRTSNVSMRYSRKARHNVTFRTSSGFIGHIPVVEFDIQSPYRDKIYGECYLESLEQYKLNDRSRLAESPLTRAVGRFIGNEIEKYAKEFEEQDRRQHTQEEKNAISKMNEALDKWKNRFLDEHLRGLWGTGVGVSPPPQPPLPSGKPARVDISIPHRYAGIGVSFRPRIHFYDAEGRGVRPVPYQWISEDTNVAWVDNDLMIVNTFSPGVTTIYAETLDGRLRSNRISLEVVVIDSIEISPAEIELPMGSRISLSAKCQLRHGEETNDIILVWTEANPTIARVSASGLVYGFSVGETTVVAGDDRCLAKEPAKIVVTQSEARGPGRKRGGGFPVILVSGDIDRDPDTDDYVYFSKDDPPVSQRPQDVERNIWWINSAAPLARMFLNPDNGYGYQSREWRIYHLERLIEVIVQIALTHEPLEYKDMSVNEWIMRWGAKVSEIQQAASADLANFIASGELPK